LQVAAGIVALQYVVDNEVAALLEMRPGFYFGGDVTSGSFDVPVTFYVPFYYRVGPDLSGDGSPFVEFDLELDF
jgi:hypothetical protein